jgi:hypothetical protein
MRFDISIELGEGLVIIVLYTGSLEALPTEVGYAFARVSWTLVKLLGGVGLLFSGTLAFKPCSNFRCRSIMLPLGFSYPVVVVSPG